jgi:hypothetical protein
MKSALIAAVVAAAVGPGSAMATTWINGHSIRPHSIPLNRLMSIPHGKRGPRGPAGLIDFSKVSVVNSGPGQGVPPGQVGTIRANCPAGSKAIAGGYLVTQGNDGRIEQFASVPSADLSAWITIIDNTSPTTTATISADAVCVSS